MKIRLFPLLFIVLLPIVSGATPEYSGNTGQGCLTCHLKAEGGPLSTKGLEYAASGYRWPPTGGYRVLGPLRKSVRLIVGLLHITAAFLWFGTILYVHILLRPAYASRGLPRGEVFLGLVSMAVAGVSGVLLAVSRIRGIGILFESPWGVLLSVKIAIYVVMVASALYVVSSVGPKLKKGIKKAEFREGGVMDPVTLGFFDGREDRFAYFVYRGKVYDVTGKKLWKDGLHLKHRAGEDLSEALARAPHGEEKLEGLRVVGTFDPAMKPPKTPAQKAFYFIAYMNLALVFAVLFVIALWRWGI